VFAYPLNNHAHKLFDIATRKVR